MVRRRIPDDEWQYRPKDADLLVTIGTDVDFTALASASRAPGAEHAIAACASTCATISMCSLSIRP